MKVWTAISVEPAELHGVFSTRAKAVAHARFVADPPLEDVWVDRVRIRDVATRQTPPIDKLPRTPLT